ncbi:TetR/AcrR family transcriptional regulator [Pseudonocardia sp. RS010]|uniref:TetR/AcrR family transcriptional regulator n=1 Tax=Pseudonocardia sp. RS010 TaxID=3385979 RepID=UPI00399F8843
MVDGEADQARRPASQDRILDAARQCFREGGIRRTTMSDVATASGVSRQLVYKIFLGRRELIEAAAIARIRELAADLTPDDWEEGSGAEQFVAVSVAVIRRIRTDRELQNLLGDESPVSLHEVLWLDSVREMGVAFWAPWLERARRAGVLRADLSDDDLGDWLQTVYASIILRRHIDPESERAMIERFVLTSLSMAGGAPPQG